MHGTNPRAGQHRIGRFGDHWQIQHNTVAFAHAHILKDIGHAADTVLQLAIGDVHRLVGGIIWFPYDRDLIGPRFQMAVNAVGGHVQCAIREPVDIDLAKFKGGILDPCVGLDPVDPLAVFTPECIGVRNRGGIHLAVGFRIDVRAGDGFGGWWIGLAGHDCPLRSGQCHFGFVLARATGARAGRGWLRWPDTARAACRPRAPLLRTRHRPQNRYQGSPRGRPASGRPRRFVQR